MVKHVSGNAQPCRCYCGSGCAGAGGPRQTRPGAAADPGPPHVAGQVSWENGSVASVVHQQMPGRWTAAALACHAAALLIQSKLVLLLAAFGAQSGSAARQAAANH